MKKLLFFSFFILAFALPARLLGNDQTRFTNAFSAGYVFKHDCIFKDTYGHGMANVITADGCYYPWNHWGLGAKLSYWRAKGRTAFLGQCTLLQEIPVTFYLRGMKDFSSGLQLYASLGGGVIWAREKSYLGRVQFTKGIGEVEIGLNAPIWKYINFTSALRYLFPRQSSFGTKIDVGGVDLRAGIAFVY